ncbi:YhcB family protein [Luteimonas sp. BDR2-5]|uniref:YhcB family protein n=1 Tax=Proluteimonas luteida TaxID=2878685 RepID=UPI001E2E8499|nr:YhcB family protein [Luteimonas sp. BDR2-5]MCD9026696.1 YhcB family protein [Luteimonas sp. BDR2-5]
MRRLIFYGCAALGAGIGLLIGVAQNSLGLAIFFGLKLTVVGMVLGAFFSNIGRKSSKKEQKVERDLEREEWERAELERVARMGSHDTSPEELTANYWRDKGHPPFMNPEDHDPRG